MHKRNIQLGKYKNKKTLMQKYPELDTTKKAAMWFCIVATTYFFGRIAQQLYDTQKSETKFLIGMLYFGWLAVMCK